MLRILKSYKPLNKPGKTAAKNITAQLPNSEKAAHKGKYAWIRVLYRFIMVLLSNGKWYQVFLSVMLMKHCKHQSGLSRNLLLTILRNQYVFTSLPY